MDRSNEYPSRRPEPSGRWGQIPTPSQQGWKPSSQPSTQSPSQQGWKPTPQPTTHFAEQAAAPTGNPAAPAPRRGWSTPVVAVLMVGISIISAATTTVLLDRADDQPPVVTSFDKSPNSGANRTAANHREDTPPPPPGSIAEVAHRVLPSVVSIQAQVGRGLSEGSGSVLSSDGYILTNNHVVAGADDRTPIEVTFSDDRTVRAHFVASDPQTDIAVIKAEGVKDLQPIAIGDPRKLNVGEDVVAIGAPLGLSSTVTSGIVSAKNRPVQAAGERGGEASLIDAIQTDAAINPGNSGGALVNMKGELIGVPTIIATLGGSSQSSGGSIGLGFAIPSSQASRIAQQLIETGHARHPMIGAKINTGALISGAQVATVNPGSPAEEAGLQRGDVVVSIDGRKIDSGVGLIAAIRSREVGDKVTLGVLRRGAGRDSQPEELTVTLREGGN